MSKIQGIGNRLQGIVKNICSVFASRHYSLVPKTYNLSRGFTLIETLVAISLLSISIVAPMSLTSQSLSAAFYARDQITAFNLAQEGLEAVRAVRDGQILQISQNVDASGIDLFGPIPINQNFTIDSRETDTSRALQLCPDTGCAPLQTDGTLYGYDPDTSTWPETYFTRTLNAHYVGAGQDEIRVSVTVSWPTPNMQRRTFGIYDNLYRWVSDGSGAQ